MLRECYEGATHFAIQQDRVIIGACRRVSDRTGASNDEFVTNTCRAGPVDGANTAPPAPLAPG
jgi:hypothetical protein